MEFILISSAGVIVIFLALLLIARIVPGSGAQVLDWKPTRSYETEAQLEIDDVAQMLEAQNARRRASGRPELTERDLDRLVAEDEKVRSRGRPAQEKLADEVTRFDEEVARIESDGEADEGATR